MTADVLIPSPLHPMRGAIPRFTVSSIPLDAVTRVLVLTFMLDPGIRAAMPIALDMLIV